MFACAVTTLIRRSPFTTFRLAATVSWLIHFTRLVDALRGKERSVCRRSRGVRARSLFSHRFHDDGPISGTNVKLEKYDLLPSSQSQRLILEGDEEAGSDERGSDVGMSIPVMPLRLMLVGSILWHHLVQGRREVGDQSWLILHRCNGTCRSNNEEERDTICHRPLLDDRLDPTS